MESSQQPIISVAGGADSSEKFNPLISVQELIKRPMVSIPQRYVVPSDNLETLKPHSFSTTIPTFDFQLLLTQSDLAVQKLHSICKEWGIFQLVNHGIECTILDNVNDEIKEFYKLPFEEKMRYKMRPGDVDGYGTIDRVGGKLDWGDRIFMTVNPVSLIKPHLLPNFPSSLRNSLERYISEMQRISMKLLEFIAEGLKIEKKEMEEMFEDGMQSVRITYYPPCPQPELVVGLTPHSDGSAISILHQVNQVDGLHIKKDGVWMPVTFLPNALLVNLGDVLQILSNGMYQSIEHKVTVNEEKERMSLAFFCKPRLDAEVGPAHSLINPQNPPKYRTIRMENYINSVISDQKVNGRSYLEKMELNLLDAN